VRRQTNEKRQTLRERSSQDWSHPGPSWVSKHQESSTWSKKKIKYQRNAKQNQDRGRGYRVIVFGRGCLHGGKHNEATVLVLDGLEEIGALGQLLQDGHESHKNTKQMKTKTKTKRYRDDNFVEKGRVVDAFKGLEKHHVTELLLGHLENVRLERLHHHLEEEDTFTIEQRRKRGGKGKEARKEGIGKRTEGRKGNERGKREGRRV